ncbi:MAG: polysaccharide deacetylase family protein [Turneriella sp.]|nr:polysaccharide deacetylase family protein [Turneriella sp.]
MLRRILYVVPFAVLLAEQPNELGKIPILTYHKIADEDTEYTRSREGFARDFVELKRLGFYPLSLEEFRSGKIATPRGKIPVLLTFDDSSESQFRMEPDGSPSPGCGVAIMEHFQKNNPDFPLRGIFFVLPKANYPNNFFGQPALIGQKLRYLLEHGFAIGSHTLWHANLRLYRDKIEEQLALATAEIQRYLPGYPVDTLAVPYGVFPPPEDAPRLRAGAYRGKSYRHDWIFDYSNQLSHSVYDRRFDRYHIRRLHGNQRSISRLFAQARKKRHIFFISDGDPNTVTVRKEDQGQVVLRAGQRLVTY